MDIGTIVDAHSVELLTGALGLVFAILYSFVKPADWSGQVKQYVAYGLAGALGAYVAYVHGKTSPTDLLGYITLAVGVSQVAYNQVLDKLNIGGKTVEGHIQAVRDATIDFGATGMFSDDSWVKGVKAVLNAVGKGQLTKVQGQEAIDALNKAEQELPTQPTQQ